MKDGGISITGPTGGAENAAHPRILIAGLGNILRGDDGFGPAVIRALEAGHSLPPGVRSIELGIGGIGLVQELMERHDALILVDATDRGGKPGSLYLLEPDVPDGNTICDSERHALATDTHQAVPDRTLVLARALGVLPPIVRLIGCQPAEVDELKMELSPEVQEAVPLAVEAVGELLRSIGRQFVGRSRRGGTAACRLRMKR